MKYRTVKAVPVKKSNARRYGTMKVRVCKPLKHDAMTVNFARSVALATEYKRNNHLPIAKYDEKSDRAYLEYPDGHREYVDET